MHGIAKTALLVAAIRSNESKRADRLFEDPFAEALAGEEGFATLAAYRAAAGPGVPIIEVRTLHLDEGLAHASRGGIRQVVLLAAGLDARAYRLDWPAGTRVFELDQPEVLAYKASVLSSASPRCERIAIPVDLRTDWTLALIVAGFDRGARTAWLIEGLLQYLTAENVGVLMDRVDALSATGSVAHFDLAGRVLLDSPVLDAAKQFMTGIGASWKFGTDDPALLAKHGWFTAYTDPASLGFAMNRWPFPPAPPNAAGVPRSYLVTTTKAQSTGA
jgi:methyltransferase (TIGR00027 family)